MDSHSIFVVLNYISVLVMFICLAIFSTHKESRMQKLAFTVCFSLLICCLGFLIRIEAPNAEVYLTGQKLVYAFVTHGMFCMFLFILAYCRFSIPAWVKAVFNTMNTIMSLVVITMDHHHMFYKSYTTIDMGGYVTLEKEYGFMHTVAIALFVIYMLATIIAAIVFSVKNIRKRSLYVWRMLVAVAIPCLSYLIPKLAGMPTDLQPVAFALFMLIVAVMVYKSNIYDVNNLAAEFSLAYLEDGVIVISDEGKYKGSNAPAKKIFPLLNEITLDSDLAEESPSIKEFINKQAHELISGDKIYRFETKPVLDNLGKHVGTVLWFKDITIEHNYAKLLQEKNSSLESQVETLHTISYQDDLTGICNRRGFEDYLLGMRLKEDLRSLTVIAMDINGLKETNDSLGHAAGDEIIRAAADIITANFGEVGSCFRTGGDEFYVITDNSTLPIQQYLDKMRKDLSNWSGQYAKSVSLSVGMVKGYEHPKCNIDELLVFADKEMYISKKAYYEQAGVDRRKNYHFADSVLSDEDIK